MANTKKQWKEVLADFPELKLREFLEVLPLYSEDGKPVKCCIPLVLFKREHEPQLTEQLANRGYKFVSSTVNYVSGYHHPHDSCIRGIGYIVE